MKVLKTENDPFIVYLYSEVEAYDEFFDCMRRVDANIRKID